jgi:hypothetical protein
MTLAALISVVFMPLAGKLNDNVDSAKIVPFAFGSRGLLTIAF